MVTVLKWKHDWDRYQPFKPGLVDEFTGISVIVPFRDEEANLTQLLDNLALQRYPLGMYEVILVDDHSTDASVDIAERFCRQYVNFHLFCNSPGECGKKTAVERGISAAGFDLIVTTDADCSMEESWLLTINAFYSRENPRLIIGLTDVAPSKGFLGKFQELEFLGLVAAGAGAAAGNSPVYCNAANLAYSKQLIQSYPDPLQHSLVSGDDTLFMLRVKRDHPGDIRLLKSDKAVVVTQGAGSWRQFLSQRRRWMSKSPYYKDVQIGIIAWLVLLNSACMITALGLAITGFNYWLFPVMYAGKTLADIRLVGGLMKFFKKQVPYLHFPVFELLYPFYIIGVVVTGFAGDYTWKNRKYKGGIAGQAV
jgi:glycosyltransferase involved in cell wall biosynthesis